VVPVVSVLLFVPNVPKKSIAESLPIEKPYRTKGVVGRHGKIRITGQFSLLASGRTCQKETTQAIADISG
jgi:hypothetical protein